MNELFDSSDARRAAGINPHARFATLDGPINLQLGGQLPNVVLCYETFGQLNDQKDNAVLVCHALSGDSHVARHHPDDAPGWWDGVVGPNKPIDTNRYFVICPNVLGGCQGSTGPNSINPETGQPFGRDFPPITVADMVDTQARLLEKLGIEKLLAVIGGSLGGHQTLCWATRHPDRLRGAAAIATSPRLTSQALAFDVVGRNAILRDPNFHGGQYYDKPHKPQVGLAIARMLGHITYLSQQAMTAKFDFNRFQPADIPTEFEKKFSVGSYLAHQGGKFVERFDANSYITLTTAMDMFDLGATPEQLQQSFAQSTCRWLIVCFSSDWLFPPFQSRAMANALLANDLPVSYCKINTAAGHDAFLLEHDLDRYGQLVRGFLRNLEPTHQTAAHPAAPQSLHPASIYHARRLDYDTIQALIQPGASVLDLGCGSGGLLNQLRKEGHPQLVGMEWSEEAVVPCVNLGLDVIQYDLNQGLDMFRDQQFDVVVLSQTLQAVTNVQQVIDEMLRVGKFGIVSFPNIAFAPLRKKLAHDGRTPVPGSYACEPSHTWYNTPHMRFCSIADFDDFCRDKGITVHQAVYLDTTADRTIADNPNENADTAIYLLSR